MGFRVQYLHNDKLYICLVFWLVGARGDHNESVLDGKIIHEPIQLRFIAVCFNDRGFQVVGDQYLWRTAQVVQTASESM